CTPYASRRYNALPCLVSWTSTLSGTWLSACASPAKRLLAALGTGGSDGRGRTCSRQQPGDHLLSASAPTTPSHRLTKAPKSVFATWRSVEAWCRTTLLTHGGLTAHPVIFRPPGPVLDATLPSFHSNFRAVAPVPLLVYTEGAW